MTGILYRLSGTLIIFFLALAAALAVSGCAGAPSGDDVNRSRSAYLDAYASGLERHAAGQSCFNNGTLAWEASDFRAAIAQYANASLEYSEAAKDYEVMARHARGAKEKEFAESLRGCAFNLSQASDGFVNAAIALAENDTDAAYDWFCSGHDYMDASDALLDRAIAATPGWLTALASG